MFVLAWRQTGTASALGDCGKGTHGEVFTGMLRVGIRPGLQQLVAQRQLLFFGCRVFVLLQHICQFGGLNGGFTQVTQSAAATEVDFAALGIGQFDAVAKSAVEAVSGKLQIAHYVFVAVGVGVAADFGQRIVVAQILVSIFIGEVERLYTHVFQGRNLSLFADAVVIEVAPDAEFIEDAVGSIHFAIAVFIQFGQCGKAMCSGRAVFEQGIVAKEFTAVVDFAVAVTVIHQNAVVAVHPTGPGMDTAAFVVEHCAVMTIGGEGFDTVAVQIKGDGIKY